MWTLTRDSSRYKCAVLPAEPQEIFFLCRSFVGAGVLLVIRTRCTVPHLVRAFRDFENSSTLRNCLRGLASRVAQLSTFIPQLYGTCFAPLVTSVSQLCEFHNIYGNYFAALGTCGAKSLRISLPHLVRDFSHNFVSVRHRNFTVCTGSSWYELQPRGCGHFADVTPVSIVTPMIVVFANPQLVHVRTRNTRASNQ